MNKIHWRNRFLPEQKSVCGCGKVQLFILIYVCLHFINGIHFTLNVFPAQSKSSFILYSLTLLSLFCFFLVLFRFFLYVSDKRLLIQPTKIPL